MTRIKILEGYVRFLNTSALSDKKRDLFEDMQKMFVWLDKLYTEEKEELTKQLCSDLIFDCWWRTFKAAKHRHINYVKASNGKWDSLFLNEAEKVVEQMRVTEKIGDSVELTKLWHGLHLKFFLPSITDTLKDMPAMGMYIYEVASNRSSYANKIHSSSTEYVDIYLACKDEDVLDERLNARLGRSENRVIKALVESAKEG